MNFFYFIYYTAIAELIFPSPAFYPRLALIKSEDGALFSSAALENPTANQRRLIFVTSFSATWNESTNYTVIASAPNELGGVDLGNGFLFQLENKTILCAYRHHSGVPPNRVFRIQIAASHDLGRTWGFASSVSVGSLGVWEPFLFSAAGTLRVSYSAELQMGVDGRAEQDIVFQESSNGGSDWGPIYSRLHTNGSRNGMPGVSLLSDGSLLLVFEGFWTGVWGAFTVNSARSFDSSASWVQQQVVHAPRLSANAGSPQLVFCGVSEKVCTVFMSNENEPSGQIWPSGAHAGLLCAPLDRYNVSAPLDWGASGVPIVLEAETPFIFWPSFFFSQSEHLYVAYQGSDDASYLSEVELC